MDDMLLGARTLDMLERRLEVVLQVCRGKNAKLSPSKFTLGQKVEFGGHIINYDITSNSVSITPSLDKLQTVRDLQEPRSKSEAQSLVGFLSQLSGFVPEIKICCPATGMSWFVRTRQLDILWQS